jgi:ParB-like chromosome segregation protein Spo0J
MIENWPLARLKPYSRNARTHSPEQIQQIAASITEFGWTNPILVDSDGGIVAGHGRLQAAQLLNRETVPVIVLSHLSETQRRALVLADNQLALTSGWDDKMLAEELAALQVEAFDLGKLGFSDRELKALLADLDVPVDEGEQDEADEGGEEIADQGKELLKFRVLLSRANAAREAVTKALAAAGIEVEWA